MQVHLQTIAIRSQATRSRAKQAGFSLVELSVALAIAGVVVMGALVGARKLIDSSNANAALTQMGAALANMAKSAQALGNTAIYDSTLVLAQLGVFNNASLVKLSTGDITQVKNPFGGYVWTKRNSKDVDSLPAYGGVWYILTGVPNAACIDLVSGLNNTAYSVYVSTAGTTPGTAYAGTNPTNISGTAPKVSGAAMVAANVATSCNATGSAKDIYVLTPI